jgi:HlyD family secretion protein
MQRRHIIAASAIGAVVICATYFVFRTKTVVDVATGEVTSGTIVRRIFATGTLQATRTVDVGTQVSGIVSSLGADFNSIVHKEQVIARLDPSLYEAAVNQAKGSLEQSQAALQQSNADQLVAKTAEEDARIKLTRARQLASNELITQADLDAAQIAMNEATAAVASARAQVSDAAAVVEQAKAAVKQAQLNLDHTVISAPIDGIVLNRSVDVGQTVAAAVQAPVLFTLATDLRHLQVQVNVDESDIAGIEPGQVVTFEVESYPDESFHGVVTQVRLQPIAEQTTTATTVASSTLAQQTTTVATVVSYATMIDVDNPGERLRPGMTASVLLSGVRHDRVTRIPNAAVSFRPPAAVFGALNEKEPPVPTPQFAVVSGDKPRELWTYDGHQLAPSMAELGLSDAQWTEVVKGSIRPGDRVVTNAVLKKTRP